MATDTSEGTHATPPARRRRDRDADGRAQQARPRDDLGRPLPYGSIGVPPVSDEPRPPLETVSDAASLLDEGRPFAAHEVVEARWKAAPADERDLWQGLAQLCVAITHARRGNGVGAQRLLERGADRVRGYALTAGPTYGLDVEAWVARAQAAVATATPTVR